MSQIRIVNIDDSSDREGTPGVAGLKTSAVAFAEVRVDDLGA